VRIKDFTMCLHYVLLICRFMDGEAQR
jgi:hypothetical protein